VPAIFVNKALKFSSMVAVMLLHRLIGLFTVFSTD